MCVRVSVSYRSVRQMFCLYVCMYLTFLEGFPEHVSSMLRSSKNVIILGDFNIPWNKPEHSDTITMREILDMYYLHQHINIQTHKLGNTLDWLISNSPDTIQDITSKDFLSDHNIIEWKFQINCKVTEKREITRRDLSKVNEESFKSDLKNNLDVNSKKTLQQNCNNYRDAIKKTIEKHAPLKTKTKMKKEQNPWFDQDAQRLKTQRRLAEKRWIKSKHHVDLIEYKQINIIYKKHLHHCKKTHILNRLSDNENKARNL